MTLHGRNDSRLESRTGSTPPQMAVSPLHDPSAASLPGGFRISTSDELRRADPERFLFPAGRAPGGTSRFKMEGIDLIVLDVDGTLAFPSDRALGGVLAQQVHRTLMSELGLSEPGAVKVADYYRAQRGGGEFAFLDPRIQLKLIELSVPHSTPRVPEAPRMSVLWDAFAAIDPTPFFVPAPHFVQHVRSWREHSKVVALTDSPTPFARKTLEILGFNPEGDFDLFRSWERADVGPPKRALSTAAFAAILKHFNVAAERTVSIGDSPDFDILPAIAAGMRVVLISPHARPVVTSIEQLIL